MYSIISQRSAYRNTRSIYRGLSEPCSWSAGWYSLETERHPAKLRQPSIGRRLAIEGITGPVTAQTAESYAATFDTNVLGVLLSMKHELRVMQTQRAGSIINLSSTMGHRGAPNASLYVASKHAVEGLTKSAALEAAAFGVRVNAVAPGPIETAMLNRFTGSPDKKAGLIAGIPLNRAGRPEEIADAILFLASDKASFITGD